MYFETFYKILNNRINLKKEEFEKITYLQLFSFFLGFFVAFYFVSANAEFVKHFGSKQLPFAYIISGLVGTGTLIIYSWIQKRTSSKNLFTYAITISIVVALLSRFLIFLVKNQIFSFNEHLTLFLEKFVSFFVFIWAWPFIALTATITGGLAIRLFNLLEVKRFYGFINLGGVVAAIISYFSISLFINKLTHQYDLIVIGTLGLFAAIFLLNHIYKKFPENKTKLVTRKGIFKTFMRNFPSRKFIYWIFVGAAFSIIAIYIADYGFLITIKQSTNFFPTSQSVAKFMSIIFGALKIGEFFISIFSGRILSKYGVSFGLLLLPITITLLEIFGLTMAYTFGVASLLFIGTMTSIKMLERIIRRGIDDPSFNVLYQTLPDDFKLFIQTRVGLIQQFSITIAGLLLVILHFLLFKEKTFQLGLYPAATLPFLFVWIIIALKLYASYKNRIHQILEEKRLFKLEYIEKDIFALDILQKNLLSSDIEVAKFSVVVLSETNPRALENYANFLLKIENKTIRKAILQNIDVTYSEKLVNTIEQVGNQIGFKERELRKLILNALYQLDYTEIGNFSYNDIQQLINSKNVKDKILACKFLFKNSFLNDTELILKLLDSDKKEVKLAAIKIAAKRKDKKLYLKLIDLLNNPQYNNILISILIEIGEPVVDFLDELFEKQTPIDILKKIIQIYAKIGTRKTLKLLLKHINYPNRNIQQNIIEALFYSEYFANSILEQELIKKKIFQVVENIIWLYASIKDIAREKNTLKLLQSLDLELQRTIDLLFALLTFIHQKEIIDLIKSNIIGENTIFAIELIDNFIDNDIKHLIIPIFEKISISQKVKKLRKYFRHYPLDFKMRLQDIIIQDYTKTDLWSKVKAIELLGKFLPKEIINNIELTKDKPKNFSTNTLKHFIENNFKNTLIPPELLVMLYHPNELLHTTVAKIILSHYPNIKNSLTKNLPEPNKQNILKAIQKQDFLIDRIKLLKRMYLFYTIPEKSLIDLAKLMRNEKFNSLTKINFTEYKKDIIIIIKGKLLYKNQREQIEFKRNDVIIKGLNIPQYAEYLEITKRANLIFISRFDFFNLLAMDKDLIGHLLDRIEF